MLYHKNVRCLILLSLVALALVAGYGGIVLMPGSNAFTVDLSAWSGGKHTIAIETVQNDHTPIPNASESSRPCGGRARMETLPPIGAPTPDTSF